MQPSKERPKRRREAAWFPHSSRSGRSARLYHGSLVSQSKPREIGLAVHKAGENGNGMIDDCYPGLVGFRANVLPSRQFFAALWLTHPVRNRLRGYQAMSDTSAIESATRRLALALDGLEAAAEERHEVDLGEDNLMAQVHALDDDRSRLASDLDAVMARARALESTNREIARRLDAAIGTIRSVLDPRER
jgi:Domain of unknown function (DUF4164)